MKIKVPNIKIPQVKIYGIDVIKNFLFFTLFIIITLFSIAFIIAPSIRYFKKNQKIYYITKETYLKTQQNYQTTLQSLNELKKKDAKIITAFQRKFNQKNFINFANEFIKVKSIEKNETNAYKNDFLKTVYFIDASIKSPEDFYKFVDALKNYKYVIKIYFPIDFEKNGSLIDLRLKIEHYRLKNLNSKKTLIEGY